MNTNQQSQGIPNSSLSEPEFEGIYGRYKITKNDEKEVQYYRISLLLCGISLSIGLLHWQLLGANMAWIWLLPMSIGLGCSLLWIHIYLRPLHIALQILWAFGSLLTILLSLYVGPQNLLTVIAKEPRWILVIGPLFASLTGVGFKEFFCFGRPEAIGLTILVPCALLGHLTRLINGEIALTLLNSASVLLIILSLRKFGMDAAADVGDKSVFNYLRSQKSAKIS
ncbi:DUF2301 domain-containing membrane protein [Prochlorococcus sp. MIT 1300]|uniref:DUF2301 domain-containing membrane protein n=1 Tax=Prochlorococcus sp. MIT 1300 TaxID=3096218 RepID=UPI002A74B461|nr:DUF2301 domain-containing membrane protein [Prochlorococcus sp. MIT 1300]